MSVDLSKKIKEEPLNFKNQIYFILCYCFRLIKADTSKVIGPLIDEYNDNCLHPSLEIVFRNQPKENRLNKIFSLFFFKSEIQRKNGKFQNTSEILNTVCEALSARIIDKEDQLIHLIAMDIVFILSLRYKDINNLKEKNEILSLVKPEMYLEVVLDQHEYKQVNWISFKYSTEFLIFNYFIVPENSKYQQSIRKEIFKNFIFLFLGNGEFPKNAIVAALMNAKLKMNIPSIKIVDLDVVNSTKILNFLEKILERANTIKAYLPILFNNFTYNRLPAWKSSHFLLSCSRKLNSQTKKMTLFSEKISSTFLQKQLNFQIISANRFTEYYLDGDKAWNKYSDQGTIHNFKLFGHLRIPKKLICLLGINNKVNVAKHHLTFFFDVNHQEKEVSVYRVRFEIGENEMTFWHEK